MLVVDLKRRLRTPHTISPTLTFLGRFSFLAQVYMNACFSSFYVRIAPVREQRKRIHDPCNPKLRAFIQPFEVHGSTAVNKLSWNITFDFSVEYLENSHEKLFNIM